jgi:hypothetical protein
LSVRADAAGTRKTGPGTEWMGILSDDMAAAEGRPAGGPLDGAKSCRWCHWKPAGPWPPAGSNPTDPPRRCLCSRSSAFSAVQAKRVDPPVLHSSSNTAANAAGGCNMVVMPQASA